jgi:hypothetical protein
VVVTGMVVTFVSMLVRVLVFSPSRAALVANLSLTFYVMLLITLTFIRWAVTFATGVVSATALRVFFRVVY